MPIWKYVRDEVLGRERVRRALTILLWTVSVTLFVTSCIAAYQLHVSISQLEETVAKIEESNPTPQKDEAPVPQTTPTQSDWHVDIMHRFEQGEL